MRRSSRYLPGSLACRTLNWMSEFGMAALAFAIAATLVALGHCAPTTALAQPVGTSGCIPAPCGRVAWWPANGNAMDSVGTHHGALLNGAGFGPGVRGPGFSLNGSGARVDLGSSPIVGSGNAPFTVALWAFPGPIPAGGFYFIIRLRQDTEFFLSASRDFLSASGERLLATFRGATHQWAVPLGQDSLPGRWNHLVAVYNGGPKADAGSYVLYRDGQVLPAGNVDQGPVGGSSNGNSIGDDPSCSLSPNCSYAGQIDEIQIFDRVLSPDEVRSLYAEVVGIPPPGIAGVPRVAMQVAPVPALETARVRWEADTSLRPEIRIYDCTGARVRRLPGLPGSHGEANWDLRTDRGSRVPPGVYWVTLWVEGRMALARRLPVVR